MRPSLTFKRHTTTQNLRTFEKWKCLVLRRWHGDIDQVEALNGPDYPRTQDPQLWLEYEPQKLQVPDPNRGHLYWYWYFWQTLRDLDQVYWRTNLYQPQGGIQWISCIRCNPGLLKWELPKMDFAIKENLISLLARGILICIVTSILADGMLKREIFMTQKPNSHHNQ